MLLSKIQITEFREGGSRRYIWLCVTITSMMWWPFLSFVWTEVFFKDHFLCTDVWLSCEQEWLFGCCCNWKFRPSTGQRFVQSPSSPAFPSSLRIVFTLYSVFPGLSMHHLRLALNSSNLLFHLNEWRWWSELHWVPRGIGSLLWRSLHKLGQSSVSKKQLKYDLICVVPQKKKIHIIYCKVSWSND